MKSFSDYISEKAPPGEKAEEWIKDNKEKFKKEYGDDWEEILYATAWKIFGESSIVEEYEPDDETNLYDSMLEDSMASTTTTAGVDNPDAKPLLKKSRVFGHECVEVDDDTYNNCIRGKIPFDRWHKYVGDQYMRDEVKKMYHRRNKLLMKNSKTGAIAYMK